MRVEVEIGTIEIDALPDGMGVEAVRAGVVRALGEQFKNAALNVDDAATRDALIGGRTVDDAAVGVDLGQAIARDLRR